MRANLIKTICFFILYVFPTAVNAQIKYVDGKLNINNAVPVGNYGMMVNTWQGMYWTCNGGSFFQLDVSPMSPRLAGSDDKIVFYNTQTHTFNNIQVAEVFNYSDLRAKENIEPLTSGLGAILNLRPVSYKWKKNDNSARAINDDNNDNFSTLAYGANDDNKTHYGFLAQEVETVIPDAVITDEEGRKLINYTTIIPMLVQAVQELQAKVLIQSSQIEQLSKEKELTEGTSSTNNRILSCSPNPTKGNINIITKLIRNTNKAKLIISNLEGEHKIELGISFNTPSVTTDISSLRTGIYIVSLYVNDALCDSKRIIKQ